MSQPEEQANQSTPKHKVDTADFLAFSDSQPSDFCPSNSSSPQKFWKQTPRNNFQNNWNNRRFSGNRNNSYNSPEHRHNRSFNSQNKRFDSPNYSFNNSRSSFNSSVDNSRSRSNRSFNSSKNGGANNASYLHPSFMEDPWAKLEELMAKQADTSIEPEILTDLPNNSNMTVET